MILGAALAVSCADAGYADPTADAGAAQDAADASAADAASVVPMYGASGCDVSGAGAEGSAPFAIAAAAAFLSRMRRRPRRTS